MELLLTFVRAGKGLASTSSYIVLSLNCQLSSDALLLLVRQLAGEQYACRLIAQYRVKCDGMSCDKVLFDASVRAVCCAEKD